MTNHKNKNENTYQTQYIPPETAKTLTFEAACKAEIFVVCCVCKEHFYCSWKGACINQCENFQPESEQEWQALAGPGDSRKKQNQTRWYTIALFVYKNDTMTRFLISFLLAAMWAALFASGTMA